MDLREWIQYGFKKVKKNKNIFQLIDFQNLKNTSF
jgi:hypothetical protein